MVAREFDRNICYYTEMHLADGTDKTLVDVDEIDECQTRQRNLSRQDRGVPFHCREVSLLSDVDEN